MYAYIHIILYHEHVLGYCGHFSTGRDKSLAACCQDGYHGTRTLTTLLAYDFQ